MTFNPKTVDRVHARTMDKWNTNKGEAYRYLEACVASLSQSSAKELHDRLPLPLAQHAQKTMILMLERRKTNAVAAQQLKQASIERVRLAAEQERSELDALRQEKDRLAGPLLIRFLACLSPTDRDKIASPSERKAAVELRKNALLTGKVRTLLRCSQAELDRWDADGRLPHLFVRVLRFERATACRFWAADEVAASGTMVDAWRRQDAVLKSETLRQNRKARSSSPRPVDPAKVRRRRMLALLKSAAIDAILEGAGISIAVPIRVWTEQFGASSDIGVVLQASMMLSVEVEQAVAHTVPTLAGRRRAVVVDGLRQAAHAVGQTTRAAAEGVAAAWQQRVAKLCDGFEAAAQQAFQTCLAARLAAMTRIATEAPLPDMGPVAMAARLGQQLDRALVEAVNHHAKSWGVEHLRQQSGLADYAALFPAARAVSRRLLLHVGPTNSGKTHAALDVLASAASGAYLAPLRLMALEGAERMNIERGVATDMLTGEEMRRIAGSRHVSATVEMADLTTPVAVAVIDEIQMIADRDRGWAWTQALVGIPAEVVVMTGSIDALPYVARIARMTGERLEVVMFERKTPLDALPKPVSLDGIRDGDAIVAFRRSEVLRLRDELLARGRQVATIYGALGPEVRSAQAARFRSGEATVLVATDAIAMGLNLPIRRVLLSALSKFDGISQRRLTDGEIRQVAGRAGRFGLAERGEAGVLEGEDPDVVRRALAAAPRPPVDDRVPVMPPWAAVQAVSAALLTDDLAPILLHVTKTLLHRSVDLRPPNLEDALIVCSAIAASGLGLRDRYHYMGCPIDTRSAAAVDLLRRWASVHAQGGLVNLPVFAAQAVPDSDRALEACEQAVKLLTAYLWLSMRYPACYRHAEAAGAERDRANGLIDCALQRKSIRRSCRRCGTRLPRNHRFPICEECFQGCDTD